MVDFSLWDIARNLLMSVRWTVALSLVAFLGGGIVGLLLLYARLGGGRVAGKLVGGYVQVFQGTPLLIQLFLAFFGIAALGGALGQGRAAATALDGIARNPGAADKIRGPMILGLALIESLVIYSLIVAFLLLGKF